MNDMQEARWSGACDTPAIKVHRGQGLQKGEGGGGGARRGVEGGRLVEAAGRGGLS